MEDRSYLIKFLRNLLLNEKNPLKNRDLHISDISTKTDNSKESRIINLIKNNPSIKSNEMAESLNVSVRTIKSILAALQQDNKIKRVNGKKYGHWEIIENK